MSASFSINYTNWQSLDKLNELQLAYSERMQVLGVAPQDLITAGTDIQAVSYWTTYQFFLENYCTNFVNPGDVPNNFTDVYAWRSAAGLNSNGFRKSTDGLNFTYGTMEEGDIIGSWIFEDIRKGFSALKWTNNAGSFSGLEIIGFVNGGDWWSI